MQVTHCLPTPGLNATKQHRSLTLPQASSALLRRHCQLTLNFSPLVCNRLCTGHMHRLIDTVLCAQMTPREDDIDKSKDEEARGPAKPAAAAAALVLAYTLGAICTSWNSRNKKSIQSERAILEKKLPRIPKRLEDMLHEDELTDELTQLKHYLGRQPKEAIESLFADWKKRGGDNDIYNIGFQLTELLINQLIKYFDQLGTTEKREAEIKSLLDELKKRGRKDEMYSIGLMLTDILITQGDYKEADLSCKETEEYKLNLDVRPQIHRAILNMMLSADKIGSEEETEETIKKIKDNAHKFIDLLEQKESGPSPPKTE